MRRKDREMDYSFGNYVLDKAQYLTLSMIDNKGLPYAVILSMVRMEDKLYFHSAKTGKKVDLLNENPQVYVTGAVDLKIISEKFTTEFASVSISGAAKEILEDEKKIEVLRAICQKYTPDNMDHFDSAIKRSLKVTAIWEIEIQSLTSKRKKYDVNGQELKKLSID